jgi:lysylphosphatidylglycerol synthetase-like protein (DUF2156 family)
VVMGALLMKSFTLMALVWMNVPFLMHLEHNGVLTSAIILVQITNIFIGTELASPLVLIPCRLLSETERITASSLAHWTHFCITIELVMSPVKIPCSQEMKITILSVISLALPMFLTSTGMILVLLLVTTHSPESFQETDIFVVINVLLKMRRSSTIKHAEILPNVFSLILLDKVGRETFATGLAILLHHSSIGMIPATEHAPIHSILSQLALNISVVSSVMRIKPCISTTLAQIIVHCHINLEMNGNEISVTIPALDISISIGMVLVFLAVTILC